MLYVLYRSKLVVVEVVVVVVVVYRFSFFSSLLNSPCLGRYNEFRDNSVERLQHYQIDT